MATISGVISIDGQSPFDAGLAGNEQTMILAFDIDNPVPLIIGGEGGLQFPDPVVGWNGFGFATPATGVYTITDLEEGHRYKIVAANTGTFSYTPMWYGDVLESTDSPVVVATGAVTDIDIDTEAIGDSVVISGDVDNSQEGTYTYVGFMDASICCLLGVAVSLEGEFDGAYPIEMGMPLHLSDSGYYKVAFFPVIPDGEGMGIGTAEDSGWYNESGSLFFDYYDDASLVLGGSTGIDFDFDARVIPGGEEPELPENIVGNDVGYSTNGKIALCTTNSSHSGIGLLEGVYICGVCGSELDWIKSQPILFSRGSSVVAAINDVNNEFADIMVEDY